MPLPKEEPIETSFTRWRWFSGASAVETSARFNFRENVPESVSRAVQDRTDMFSVKSPYTALLVMPQDDSLFISLLDALAAGKVMTPACFEPEDVQRVLISRANTYLPIAVTAMRDYFSSMGHADKGTFDADKFKDAEELACAEGWSEIIARLQNSASPATDMSRIYDAAGMESVVDALLAGVPEEDLFA